MIRWPLAVKSLCDGHVINYRWAEGAHVDLIDHATGRRIESSAAPATGAARIPRFVSIQPRPSTGSSSSAPYCPRVPKATTEFVKKVLSPHSNAVDDKDHRRTLVGCDLIGDKLAVGLGHSNCSASMWRSVACKLRSTAGNWEGGRGGRHTHLPRTFSDVLHQTHRARRGVPIPTRARVLPSTRVDDVAR